MSLLGAALAGIYLAIACYITQDELRHTGGGWINLRGMGTTLATAPSQVTLGTLFRWLGIPKVNFAVPGVLGIAQLAVHILVTATVVYGIGFGLQWLARWTFGSGRA